MDMEESLKVIEEMIKSYKEADKCGLSNNDFKNEIKALEYIVSDYKRLQEEFQDVDHECDRLEKIDFEKDMKIKELQKENEELKADRDKFKKALAKRITYCNELEKDLFENCSNYIVSKQKIKDKIEEINKMIAYEHNDAVIIQLGKQKRVLQKLLESEE